MSRFAFAAAVAAQLPNEPGRLSSKVFERGQLELRYYAPRGNDPQKPHDRDEIYMVLAGRGSFLCSGQRSEFGPGDVLFAPAGAEHRFEDFSDDFATWVVFYGPESGERVEDD